jgi:hypothetical protein
VQRRLERVKGHGRRLLGMIGKSTKADEEMRRTCALAQTLLMNEVNRSSWNYDENLIIESWYLLRFAPACEYVANSGLISGGIQA